MNQDLDIIRKRAIYRSKHRGCKETDILLGGFAESAVESFSGAELGVYEEFLDEADADIYGWLNGSIQTPDKYKDILAKLLKFHSL